MNCNVLVCLYFHLITFVCMYKFEHFPPYFTYSVTEYSQPVAYKFCVTVRMADVTEWDRHFTRLCHSGDRSLTAQPRGDWKRSWQDNWFHQLTFDSDFLDLLGLLINPLLSPDLFCGTHQLFQFFNLLRLGRKRDWENKGVKKWKNRTFHCSQKAS